MEETQASSGKATHQQQQQQHKRGKPKTKVALPTVVPKRESASSSLKSDTNTTNDDNDDESWHFLEWTCGPTLCATENQDLRASRNSCWNQTTPSIDIIDELEGGKDTDSLYERIGKKSLYHKTMTTAALANSGGGDASQANNNTRNNPEALQKAAHLARGLADDASKAIGNLLPTASLQNITTRKYTLPDKTVASQVLMYRQLLHTSCRPGLKLSRPYQATPAQRAVIHMPWWEKGIEESQKMIISYDNLITRYV